MNEPASPYPSAGEIVDGKYRIEKMLGEGGMGAVARATHVVLGGTVALKFMNPQFMTFPGAVERFVNEGRASKAIKSDHVLPVSDVGLLANGTPYLLMECLYGVDLSDLLARDGPSGLPVPRAMHFVIQILRGLQAAHAIGIIHRDMKPSNCFVVTHDGEEDFVKILDFGISKVVQPGSSSLTQTNSALGTPLYMSPEQARSPRDVDTRSDLYSVGVILYELLCGRTPFFSESGEFTEILFQLFTAEPPPIRQHRPDLPPELAAVVHKALAREPDKRHATALELAEALLPFATEKSAALVERMRAFRPPTHTSVPPMEGLPTSMAAFSQLQRHGTDMMARAPKTDVQAGPPVTEVTDTPRVVIQAKTEVLQGRGAVAAASPEMRVRPDEALGKTQYEPDPRRHTSQPPPNELPAAVARPSTDLGASRDAEPASPPARRSPLLFALPVVAVVAIGATGFLAMSKMKSAGDGPAPSASALATSAPSATAPTTVAPGSASAAPAIASASASASASAAPEASASASASAPASASAAPTPKTTSKPAHRPGYIPGLDNGLQQ